MGFDGLVLTDDLDMGAIAKHYDLPEIVEQCLAGTVDVLLICHPGPKIENTLNHIRILYEKDDFFLKRRAAVKRILKYKKTYLERQ
jgi:beta-N-acetylhexosaminidase